MALTLGTDLVEQEFRTMAEDLFTEFGTAMRTGSLQKVTRAASGLNVDEVLTTFGLRYYPMSSSESVTNSGSLVGHEETPYRDQMECYIPGTDINAVPEVGDRLITTNNETFSVLRVKTILDGGSGIKDVGYRVVGSR